MPTTTWTCAALTGNYTVSQKSQYTFAATMGGTAYPSTPHVVSAASITYSAVVENTTGQQFRAVVRDAAIGEWVGLYTSTTNTNQHSLTINCATGEFGANSGYYGTTKIGMQAVNNSSSISLRTTCVITLSVTWTLASNSKATSMWRTAALTSNYTVNENDVTVFPATASLSTYTTLPHMVTKATMTYSSVLCSSSGKNLWARANTAALGANVGSWVSTAGTYDQVDHFEMYNCTTGTYAANGGYNGITHLGAAGNNAGTGQALSLRVNCEIILRVEWELLDSMNVNIGGVWKTGTPWVNVGGVWKQGDAFVNIGGVWKPGI